MAEATTDDWPMPPLEGKEFDGVWLDEPGHSEYIGSDSRFRRAKPIADRAIVGCDEGCEAFEEPETPEEIRAAFLHWRDHGFLKGCSHAR